MPWRLLQHLCFTSYLQMALFLCFHSAFHVVSAEIRIKPNPAASLLYIKQHQVPLHTSTRPNRINNRSVKPLYTMSQHGFQRQQSGNLRLQDEITQRQVWSLAIGYFTYLIVASMIFCYYSRYADEKHRREMVEQARGKQ
jgi:hypothetical protein